MKFEHGLRLLNHPMHVMVVHFPIGLLMGSVVWDVIGLVSGEALWWTMSYYTLALGLVTALLAVIVGSVDYIAVMSQRAQEVGATLNAHVLAAMVGTGCFLASWLMRGGAQALDQPSYWAVGLSGAGAAILGLAGRLGGQLVLEFGVGRTPGDSSPS